jgi:hypothetical protein
VADDLTTTALRIPSPRDAATLTGTVLGEGSESGTPRVEVEEHYANVVRFRVALMTCVVIVPGFGLLDLLVELAIQPGVLAYFLTIRGFVLANAAAISWWLRTRPLPTPTQLYVLESYSWGLGSLMIGLMCAEYGGLASPYAPGFMVVIGVAGAATVDRWQRGLKRLASVLLTGPTTLLAITALDPARRVQFLDVAALAHLGEGAAFLLVTFALTLLGSHTMWTLRRQVFASRSIGRYRLERKLGQGGMGEVWAAHHSGLRRNVAVKLLRSGDAHAERIDRFEREVAALSELRHPNTVRVFDYGVTEDGIWYYAMELLEGEDLAKLRAREGALDPARAARIVEQAARALGEAHERGIVHRDIKPANLFITKIHGERDFVKVLDFGVAFRPDGEPRITATGILTGTPAYLAPELVRGGQADARADIYALGTVLFDLCAGRLPFHGVSTPELLFSHVEVAPPDLRSVAPDVPAGLAAIVARCLAKQPSERFATATELADALAPHAARPTRPDRSESAG